MRNIRAGCSATGVKNIRVLPAPLGGGLTSQKCCVVYRHFYFFTAIENVLSTPLETKNIAQRAAVLCRGAAGRNVKLKIKYLKQERVNSHWF